MENTIQTVTEPEKNPPFTTISGTDKLCKLTYINEFLLPLNNAQVVVIFVVNDVSGSKIRPKFNPGCFHKGAAMLNGAFWDDVIYFFQNKTTF